MLNRNSSHGTAKKANIAADQMLRSHWLRGKENHFREIQKEDFNPQRIKESASQSSFNNDASYKWPILLN